MNPQPEEEESNIIEGLPIRRRKLLPWWIRLFTWLFLLFGAIVPFGLIFGSLGMKFEISLYGIETNDPLTIIGLSLVGLYLIKGIIAYGLWWEKDWVIKPAKLDAIIGIVICTFMTFIYPFMDGISGEFSFRGELLILIPYLIRLGKIEKEWNAREAG